MRAARRGRMGQRHEAKAQALPADGGKGISEAGIRRDVFSVPRPGRGGGGGGGGGGIPDALPERAAVISEGKRGLQSMYVWCQL